MQKRLIEDATECLAEKITVIGAKKFNFRRFFHCFEVISRSFHAYEETNSEQWKLFGFDIVCRIIDKCKIKYLIGFVKIK